MELPAKADWQVLGSRADHHAIHSSGAGHHGSISTGRTACRAPAAPRAPAGLSVGCHGCAGTSRAAPHASCFIPALSNAAMHAAVVESPWPHHPSCGARQPCRQ
ncbi:hypothetical protein E2562_015063 [Oryza meyeriana var. granulata]|uniref:Uncharacterized protein n=1 Tax=Oryza meyeriana var. granulata TaxID=110450 RepID=A0A6G1EJJ5_9ORYZ|nr:hypothetical protein E2562_015063 [Oryza meyeriana var. granulata]